jgi:uncharacterized protein (TIGR00369 family)
MTHDELEALLVGSPFQRLLGLRLEAVDVAAQTLVLRSAFGPQVERAPGTGQYHGGVIASLIDIAGDFALIAVLGYGVPTINFRVDYLRPALRTDLLATGPRAARGTHGRRRGHRRQRWRGPTRGLGRGCYGTQAG